jgi:cytochrome P450
MYLLYLSPPNTPPSRPLPPTTPPINPSPPPTPLTSLTDAQCEDQILVLLFAGHDTSSTTLARILWRLALNPAAWEELKREQAAAAAAEAAAGRGLDGAALRAMPYTEAVIKEAMRCDNIIGAVPRKAARDFDLGGFLVEKGQTLLVPLTYLTKHDPRWAGQGAFEPARWLEKGAADREGWIMPFGAGNR